MAKLYFILFVSFFLACSNDKQQEVVETRDLLDRRIKTMVLDSISSENDEPTDKENHFYSSLFCEEITRIDNLNNQKFFLDRFNPRKIEKKVVYYREDSIQHLSFQFKDSIDKNNALYNYIDYDKKIKFLDSSISKNPYEIFTVGNFELNIFRGKKLFEKFKNEEKALAVFKKHIVDFRTIVFFKKDKTIWMNK